MKGGKRKARRRGWPEVEGGAKAEAENNRRRRMRCCVVAGGRREGAETP